MIHYQRMRWPTAPTWSVYDGDERLGVIELTSAGRFHIGPTSHSIDRETSYATRRDAASALRERE